MSDDRILNEGGSHRVRRIGADRYEMSIEIPPDADGFAGRECPDKGCSPGYFKVKLGTGITEDQIEAYCPYCKQASEPDEFITQSQIDYATKVLESEALRGIDRMMKSTLGLDSRGRRELVGGPLSIQLSYKPPPIRRVGRPLEEELRRDIRCPHCGLEHAVFGLATWCADCGEDIFVEHVAAECTAIERMLDDVASRRERLGSRVAARDVENALEDTVSVFEAVLKFITRRALLSRGVSSDEVDSILQSQIRNSFQNIERAAHCFAEHCGVPLFEPAGDEQRAFLAATFEKRHPITHNLGVIDRQYLDRVRSGELRGREIRVTVEEVKQATGLVLTVLKSAYQRTAGTSS